ncbi:MAG: F0F1 ATP synthase subunit B [Phycisphaerales bacterium]|nr:F0F1 ATP synthase subunit B [Phycisphaerales bacterium]
MRTPSLYLFILATGAFALLGAPALAQHDGAAHGTAVGGHAAHETLSPIPGIEEGVITGVTAIVVFILVFAVLALKVWPTISKALDERAQKIHSEIESAEMAQQQARAALAQYEKNLADARAEAQRMLEQAKVQQQALATDLKGKAEIELAALRDRARRDIEAAKRAALAEIYNEAANLATSVAGKILRREIGPGDQQRLVQESLQELQGVGRA